MDLLVVRHARAGDRAVFAATAQPDAERPLTAKGIRRMEKAARGLRAIVPSIRLLVTSPFRRAVETAQIISDAYGGMQITQRDELAPDSGTERLIDWLDSQRQQRVVCIVGHEPDLSELLKALLADKSQVPAKLKKGSISLIQFAGAVAASAGTMQWHHTAKELASQA